MTDKLQVSHGPGSRPTLVARGIESAEGEGCQEAKSVYRKRRQAAGSKGTMGSVEGEGCGAARAIKADS